MYKTIFSQVLPESLQDVFFMCLYFLFNDTDSEQVGTTVLNFNNGPRQTFLSQMNPDFPYLRLGSACHSLYVFYNASTTIVSSCASVQGTLPRFSFYQDASWCLISPFLFVSVFGLFFFLLLGRATARTVTRESKPWLLELVSASPNHGRKINNSSRWREFTRPTTY